MIGIRKKIKGKESDEMRSAKLSFDRFLRKKIATIMVSSVIIVQNKNLRHGKDP